MGNGYNYTKNPVIGVRLRNEVQKQSWVGFAKKNDITLTELIISAVEQFIQPSDEILIASDLKAKVFELQEELKECKEEIESKKRSIRGYRSDIEALKSKAFTEDTMGHRTFGKNLVDLLRTSNRPLREHELFKLLEIDRNDLSNTKGLANQLRNLEDLGLVEFTAHGWRWSNE